MNTVKGLLTGIAFSGTVAAWILGFVIVISASGVDGGDIGIAGVVAGLSSFAVAVPVGSKVSRTAGRGTAIGIVLGVALVPALIVVLAFGTSVAIGHALLWGIPPLVGAFVGSCFPNS